MAKSVVSIYLLTALASVGLFFFFVFPIDL